MLQQPVEAWDCIPTATQKKVLEVCLLAYPNYVTAKEAGRLSKFSAFTARGCLQALEAKGYLITGTTPSRGQKLTTYTLKAEHMKDL